jgi:hypothetical protein
MESSVILQYFVPIKVSYIHIYKEQEAQAPQRLLQMATFRRDAQQPASATKDLWFPDPVRACTFPLTLGPRVSFSGMKVKSFSRPSASWVFLVASPHSHCG